MNAQETYRCQSLPIRNKQIGSARPLQTRRFLLTGLWPLIVLLALPGAAFAQSLLLDDAHTSTVPRSLDSNFGTNPNLFVSEAGNVYIKFKLSPTLPAGTPGSAVERATLKLYLANVTTAGKLDVYAVAGSWDEATVTARSAPLLGNLLMTTTQIGMDKRNEFFIIDITSIAQQWLGYDGQGTNGMANYGLALIAHSRDPTTPEVASITFDSKENSQTSHEPQLNLYLQSSADGLQSVEHDATRVGDGTAASHLGVAVGGIDTTHMDDGAVMGAKIGDGAVASSDLADGSVTSVKITAPLSLVSADPGATLSVENTGAGAALTATGAINTTTQYNIDGVRVLSTPGVFNTFAGASAGRDNTTGKNNAFFGSVAGASNTTGESNSFFGFSAGAANTGGSGNVFVGGSAGRANTTGGLNAFYGFSAGAANTTGFFNSFFGANAGLFNSTGISNSFFWRSAGQANTAAGLANTTGDANSFFGIQAGVSNTTGSSNSFFGADAGISNTTGFFNSFVGRSAGRFNSTGGSNSFFGANAGSANATGNGNSFFGNSAGFSNTTGFNNSFFGNQAGQFNTTGFYNSFFGVLAGQANTAGQSNSFFGFIAGEANTTGRENSFFGDTAGRFNTAGDNNSFFGRAAGARNATGTGNSFVGWTAGFSNTSGGNNVFFGSGAGWDNTTGSRNTYVGVKADGAGDLTNAAAFGADAFVTQNNSLVLGSINGVNGANADTNVGIGTTAPRARLHVAGGKVYVEANGQGVVLKSPGGTCFELTVTNAGANATAAVPCP